MTWKENGVGRLKDSNCPLHWQHFSSDLVSIGSCSRYPFPESESSMPTCFVFCICPFHNQPLPAANGFIQYKNSAGCFDHRSCKRHNWTEQSKCVLMGRCKRRLMFCMMYGLLFWVLRPLTSYLNCLPVIFMWSCLNLSVKPPKQS